MELLNKISQGKAYLEHLATVQKKKKMKQINIGKRKL